MGRSRNEDGDDEDGSRVGIGSNEFSDHRRRPKLRHYGHPQS